MPCEPPVIMATLSSSPLMVSSGDARLVVTWVMYPRPASAYLDDKRREGACYWRFRRTGVRDEKDGVVEVAKLPHGLEARFFAGSARLDGRHVDLGCIAGAGSGGRHAGSSGRANCRDDRVARRKRRSDQRAANIGRSGPTHACDLPRKHGADPCQ